MKNKIKKLTVILGLITILANIGMASSKPSNKKAPAQKVCKDKNGKTVKCKVTQNKNTKKPNTTVTGKGKEKATSSK